MLRERGVRLDRQGRREKRGLEGPPAPKENKVREDSMGSTGRTVPPGDGVRRDREEQTVLRALTAPLARPAPEATTERPGVLVHRVRQALLARKDLEALQVHRPNTYAHSNRPFPEGDVVRPI